MTPEPIAEYIAKRCEQTFKENTESVVDDDDDPDPEEKINVLDAFGGVGGNIIQFSKLGFCVGIDNDPQKVGFIKNNCEIYGL